MTPVQQLLIGMLLDDGGGGTFVLNVEQTSLIHESYDVVIERCYHAEVQF